MKLWNESTQQAIFWMYETFYNLQAEPFRLSPDHKFCYEHNSYAKARAYMVYAFKRAEGFVMITGRPGTGKTTLIGELVENLAQDKVATANLVCTQLEADDLLKSVAFSFGIGSKRADKAELLQRLNVLFQRRHREGRRALLIVDEAQDLSPSAMEELRLLTNIQLGGQPLLQIFLLGQPELRDLILSPEMEQVHQRIVAATHIEGLESDETEAYVMHRLQAVGWCGDPAIDRAIFPLIHRFSEGVPRRINLICSRLFLLGSVEQRHTIAVDDVRVVIGELQAENLAAGTSISDIDFLVSGEAQWVPVPGEITQHEDCPEVYLHAINSESFSAADSGSAPSNIDSKKKAKPAVTTELKPTDSSGSHLPESAESGFETDGSSATDVTDQLTPDIIPVASHDRVPAKRRTHTGPRYGWGRVIGFSSLILIAIMMVFFLGTVVSRQNEGAYRKIELPPEGASTPGEQPQPKASISEASTLSNEGRVGGGQVRGRIETDEFVAESLPSAPIAEEQELELVLSGVSPSATRASADDFIESSLLEPVDTPDGIDLPSLAHLPAENPLTNRPDNIAEDSAGLIYLVQFSFDSNDPLEESQPALAKAVAWMIENPEGTASIEGFADNQGDELYNLALSRERAEAVEQYLVEAGIERHRLQVEGLGVFGGSADNTALNFVSDMRQYRIVQITLANEIGR
ncbi:MAG: AAA family ATPase [Halioglobus sp.]|nr:AAA family ATPase [Halioglobus sp.]